jgi:hypothetical protein
MQGIRSNIPASKNPNPVEIEAKSSAKFKFIGQVSNITDEVEIIYSKGGESTHRQIIGMVFFDKTPNIGDIVEFTIQNREVIEVNVQEAKAQSQIVQSHIVDGANQTSRVNHEKMIDSSNLQFYDTSLQSQNYAVDHLTRTYNSKINTPATYSDSYPSIPKARNTPPYEYSVSASNPGAYQAQSCYDYSPPSHNSHISGSQMDQYGSQNYLYGNSALDPSYSQPQVKKYAYELQDTQYMKESPYNQQAVSHSYLQSTNPQYAAPILSVQASQTEHRVFDDLTRHIHPRTEYHQLQPQVNTQLHYNPSPYQNPEKSITQPPLKSSQILYQNSRPQESLQAQMPYSNSIQPNLYGHPIQPVQPIHSMQYINPIQPMQSINHIHPMQSINHIQSMQSINHIQPMHSINHIQPIQSIQPIQPMQSINHIQPTQSIQPMQSIQPIQPIKPIQDIQSIHPMQSIQPVQSNNPNRPSNYIQPNRSLESDPPYLISHFNVLNESKLSTVSPCRIPIRSLKLLYPNKPGFSERIDTLSKSFESWRRARGDGNCYYRAVGVIYLEHLCSNSSDLAEFKNLINRLSSLLQEQDPNIQSSRDFYPFIHSIYNLYSHKERYGRSVELLQDYLQNTSFDLGMILALRVLAYRFLDYMRQNPDFSAFLIDGGLETLKRMKTMGEEAESEEFQVLADALGAKISHISVMNSYNVDTFTPTLSQHICTEISILYKSGHYDILYSAATNLRDSYDADRMQFESMQ